MSIVSNAFSVSISNAPSWVPPAGQFAAVPALNLPADVVPVNFSGHGQGSGLAYLESCISGTMIDWGRKGIQGSRLGF